MAKKDDRNLNITIKNQEDKADEVVVSISTVIKKLKKYLFVWIVAAVFFVVASFGYAAITTHVNKPELSALVSFSYSGIEKGLAPDGRKFDVNTLKDPSVIKDTLTELDIDQSELEAIRQGISFKGVIPKDAADRITLYDKILDDNTSGGLQAAEKILDTTYFPTQYFVYFNYNETDLSDKQAVDVLNGMLKQYETYFYKTYGYNEAIGSAVAAIDYQDYDYSEALDVFSDNISTLKRYVKQLSNDDKARFRSAETGYTFDDLYDALDTVQSVDIDRISSYVSIYNLTKDKDQALAYYEYRIKAMNREQAAYEEELASYEASIASYEKDQIIIFGNGTNDTNTTSSIASEQYDKMIQAKNNIAASLARTKQRVEYYKERQEALQNNPVGSNEYTETVEANLASVKEKVSKLVDLVKTTSDEYYKSVTFGNAYTILVPASSTVSSKLGLIIDNAKMPLVVLEALAFLVFFGVAFVEALVQDNKKRKALAAGLAPEEDDEDEDSIEDVIDAVEEAADEAEEDAEEKKSVPKQNSSNSKNKNKKKK
jgi:hypothetical protein